MTLAIPFHQVIRRRPQPLQPFRGTMSRTQHIYFDPDQLSALEIDLGEPFALHGVILGKEYVVTGSCASRQPHAAFPQQGHWQDDLLANLDATARAMIQLQLPDQHWTWEWRGAEYVCLDLAIVPAEPKPQEPEAPKPRNRLRR